MRKLRYVGVISALLVALIVDSSAQPRRDSPAGSQDHYAQIQQQESASDDRGTTESPLVIQPLPTKKSAEETTREQREANEKHDADWWTWILSLLTLLAIAGQLIVLGFQAYFLHGTLLVTKDAADAANLNAQAVIDGDRAHLYVLVTQHDVSETIDAVSGDKYTRLDPSETMRGPALSYIFLNSGKTPAILEEVMHGMTIQESEKHTINYIMPERALEILPADESSEQIAVSFHERAFFAKDAKALGDHALMLFFYSAATFRDIFNRQHKIRHDFLYSAGRFHLINRIEKTYDAPKQDDGEKEQTARVGFFGRPD